VEARVETTGNPYCAVILRGGNGTPNYLPEKVYATQELLRSKGLRENLLIDVSHGNSGKDYREQPKVFRNVVEQMAGNKGIIGMLVESYINEGNQKDAGHLRYGVSITDSCISLETTRELIKYAYDRL